MKLLKFTKDNRVSARFNLNVQIKIMAQLIGSSSKFEFLTETISTSGLTIQHEAGLQHAFNANTILEVWIESDHHELIYFFAKYIRKASDTAFTISIVDLDSKNEKLLSDFINRLQLTAV